MDYFALKSQRVYFSMIFLSNTELKHPFYYKMTIVRQISIYFL